MAPCPASGPGGGEPPPAFLNSEIATMNSSSRTLLWTTLAAGLLLGTVAVQAQDAPPPPPPPGAPGPMAHGPGPLRQEMLAKYDTNKDGKLDESERAAMRMDHFKAMDKKGTGKISKADFPAAMEAARQAERTRREAEMFDKIDTNKDGYITAEEFAAFKPDWPGKDGPRRHKRN
ncbi:hypothetical protein GE253_01185 [Niveispirillum sp. SYP-B3756]|nr:hypothetical protein [Niveispirillum sp. SYP-B3756]